MKLLFIFVTALLYDFVCADDDPVAYKLEEQQYHYIPDDEGEYHLVDFWVKKSDLMKTPLYLPDKENIYHLYTMNGNLQEHEEIVYKEDASLENSRFNAEKTTYCIIHGWRSSSKTDFATELTSAIFEAAPESNVIVVDWSKGSGSIDYRTAVANTLPAGVSVANFIKWVISVTRGSLSSYRLIGHSLGAQQAGIVGRELGGKLPSIVALDPALPGWRNSKNLFRSTDAETTQVIHTNGGIKGFLEPLGNYDFYPNRGMSQPGCILSSCDHKRAWEYYKESVTSGGFTSTLCENYKDALQGHCASSVTLEMGGLTPSTGQPGAYFLNTKAEPPFSQVFAATYQSHEEL